MPCFDILNIEYNEEGYLLDFRLPDTMRICVKEGDNWSHTEEAIRKQINNIEELYANDVKVVDFTAFYEGTDKPLRGNYEDYDTHGEYAFMQAEQKKLHPGLYRYKGKIGLRKGWTECQTCDDLVKLNDINWYYLKGYGQATVCDSCVGKYNYKKDRLSKGHRHGEVAILQFMEQDRKEAETFEAREKKIGSITIKKNPNFPSGTHLQGYIKTNRAELRKVFGNPNMGESGDGKSKGKEWNLIVGGKRVTIYDYREKDKKGTKYFNIGGDSKYGALLVAQALSLHRNEKVHAIEISPAWSKEKFGYARGMKFPDSHDILTYERAKEYEDNRRGYRAETFEASGKSKIPFDVINIEYQDESDFDLMNPSDSLLNWPYTMTVSVKHDENKHFSFTKDAIRAELESYISRQQGEPVKVVDFTAFYAGTNDPLRGNYEDYEAETFNVEFNEWADQEMMTHGKDISFKDWAEDEGMKHGNVPITDWAQHEEESHDARYGSEEEEIWEDEDYYNIEGEDYWDRIEGMYEDFCEDWEDNPDNDGQECPSMDEWVDTYGNFDAEDLNWGGDPKGQLATAIRKARIKAKEPKKPLKIEKLDAEEGGFYQLEVKYKMEDGWEHHSDYDNEEDATSAYYDIYLKYPEVILLEVDSEGEGDVLYRQRNYDVQSAETSDYEKLEYIHSTLQDCDGDDVMIETSLGFVEDLREPHFNAEMVWTHSMEKREHKPKAIPHIGGGAKYNGYFAIKGYEGDTKDGFRYRIFKDPYDKKEWYDANVYDVQGRLEDRRENSRLNPRFNSSSITVGSFPTLEQAKRALVFRMIQDEQYYHRLTDSELDWLMFGTKIHNRKWKKAETSGQWEIGEQLEEAQMNAEETDEFLMKKDRHNKSVVIRKTATNEAIDKKVKMGQITPEEGEVLKGIKGEEARLKKYTQMRRKYDPTFAKTLNAEGKKKKKISGLLSDPFDELSLDSGGMKSVVVGIGIGLLACFGYSKWK